MKSFLLTVPEIADVVIVIPVLADLPVKQGVVVSVNDDRKCIALTGCNVNIIAILNSDFAAA